MSSIRLFILDALDKRGDMHGHQLRLLAEEEHVQFWTDITVGSLYGAIKRLANEGLIVEVRTEREGGYPERQVYAVSASGRAALAVLREQGLADISFRPDPFDLAITRLDPERLDELGAALGQRLATLSTRLTEQQERNRRADPYLTLAERWALQHREDRLTAEIRSHERLLDSLPDIIADEQARKVNGHD
ncbi:PadR family transcriptional regulator [Herbiconiux sp. 11R-BC]|uniref:PadR family transcriptional regulator n=1 Tax=Herbiconiux sp. 11R-BC TaxID=3111637 RepID=UPI003C10B85E